MIYFLTTRANDFPMRRYLGRHGAALAPRIRPVLYEGLLSRDELPPGAYVFADLELLTDQERQQAAEIWQDLAARGCPLLNHPTRTLRRFGLLRMLHQRGDNCFNVYRVADGERPSRFPVFVRGENDHRGSRTVLLKSRWQLATALRWLKFTSWLGGYSSETIITEFCDTKDEMGVYRKYSAFMVDGQVLPRHLFFSDRWMVKDWKLADPQHLLEEKAYVSTNPHEQMLQEIFAAAGIDYGRIDYSFCSGRIQVWEINTNPMIIDTGRGGKGIRAAIHDHFAIQIRAAWERFDARSLQPTVQLQAA